MSLLDRWNAEVLVFPEEQTVDADGNPSVAPSVSPVPARAMIQPRSTEESDNRGFMTESVYRLRFTRADEAALGVLGARSQIEWNGERWSIVGEPRRFNGSPRTAHWDYTIRRN